MAPYLNPPSSDREVETSTVEPSTSAPKKINGSIEDAPSQTFLISEALARFQISPVEYIEQRRPAIDYLVAGTIVAHGDTILLVQRSRHDFGGLCWEVPGGSCDENDLTILGAACRELWEEAGLRATAVTELVDDQHLWSEDGLNWRKLTFLVEVQKTAQGAPEVKLDPEEHEAFVWATEEDVLANCHGDIMFTWISENQRQTILEAFKMLRTQEAVPLKLEASAEA
ncbi:nudix domain protein [Seiridium cupressi]